MWEPLEPGHEAVPTVLPRAERSLRAQPDARVVDRARREGTRPTEDGNVFRGIVFAALIELAVLIVVLLILRLT